MTMFIVGDVATYRDRDVAALCNVGDRLAAAPVEVVLDRVVGSASSIALRPSRQIAALSALHRQLVDTAQAVGIAERPGHGFAAHVTLGYRQGAPFQERITPVAWRSEEVVLIHSLLGQTRHDVLGRWSLAGAEERQLALL